MSETEVDLRLQRLLFFSDGVCAIAVTLLAVELVLPEAAAGFHGDTPARGCISHRAGTALSAVFGERYFHALG